MSKHKKSIGGELIVTGENEIHIKLPKKPKEILAIFGKQDNHHHHHPCNPKHHDDIKSYVCTFHNCHCFVISYRVANIKKIFWEVIF